MQKQVHIKWMITIAVFLAVVFSWTRGFTGQSGSGGGYTNAPGESNCTSCHTGKSLTTNSSVISMKINGGSNFSYQTDSTYKISITANKSGIALFGFLVTCLDSVHTDSAGKFTGSSSDLQTTTASIGGKTRRYVMHTFNGGATSTGTKTWNFAWTAPHKRVGKVIFYVAVNATNNDGTDNGDQIFADTFSLALIPLKTPDVGFTWSPKSPCSIDSVSFKDTSKRSPTSWAWTFSGGTPATSTLQNPKVSFSSGTHAVTLVSSNSFGSGTKVSSNINVTLTPQDSVYRGGPTSICQGDSVLLFGDFSAATFNWSTGETTQAIQVKKPGTYYVTASNGACATKSQLVTVSNIPKPTVSLIRSSANDTICAGDSSYFTLSVSPHTTYAYFLNGNMIAGSPGLNVAMGGLSGTKNTMYALAFDSVGCASDTSQKYKIIIRNHIAAPILAAGTATTHSVAARWTAIPGAIGYQVSTDSGKTWKTPTGALSDTENNLASNEYIALKVRAIDKAPCNLGNIGSIQLNTLPCSQTTFKVHADSAICNGSSGAVVFSKISAPHYGIILNGVAKKDTSYAFSPTADTILNFSMIDSAKINCGSFEVNIPVKIVRVPSIFSISANKSSYCGNNDPASIVATRNFDTYQFYVNGKLAQADSSNIFIDKNFSNNDKIMMLGMVGSCSSDTSNAVLLHKFPIPTATFTDTLGYERAVVFTMGASSAQKQIWYFGDSTTDTARNPIHTFSHNNIYTVSISVTGAGGCSDSTAQPVTVTYLTKIVPNGVAQAIKPESFTVVPNPFNSSLVLSFFANQAGVMHLSVSDIQGKTFNELGIKPVQTGNNRMEISTDNLKPGTYVLRMENGFQVFTKELIKN